VIVHRVAPVTAVSLLVIAGPRFVGLLHDPLGILHVHAQPLGGEPDTKGRRCHQLHVERVALAVEQNRCRSSDQHHPALGGGLCHHRLGDTNQRRFRKLGDGALGGRKQLRRGAGQHPGQPLDERGGSLVLLGHLGGGETGTLGHALDQLVVHQPPAQRLGHPPADLGAPGAILTRDGDQHGSK
jgi:hypothetical protein